MLDKQKRIAQMEELQARLDAEAARREEESNRKIELLLSQLESERRAESSVNTSAHALLLQGGSSSEMRESYVGCNLHSSDSSFTPSTTNISFPQAGRAMKFTPAPFNPQNTTILPPPPSFYPSITNFLLLLFILIL